MNATTPAVCCECELERPNVCHVCECCEACGCYCEFLSKSACACGRNKSKNHDCCKKCHKADVARGKIIETATSAWRDNLVYFSRSGYRWKATGRRTKWSALIVQAYPDQMDFHRAAMSFARKEGAK